MQGRLQGWCGCCGGQGIGPNSERRTLTTPLQRVRSFVNHCHSLKEESLNASSTCPRGLLVPRPASVGADMHVCGSSSVAPGGSALGEPGLGRCSDTHCPGRALRLDGDCLAWRWPFPSCVCGVEDQTQNSACARQEFCSETTPQPGD